MDIRLSLAIAISAGVAVGAAAVAGLHAQAKPPAYVVVAIQSVKDADAFKAGVLEKASPARLAAAGGRYVVRTQDITSLEGPSPQRFVVIAFDNIEKAKAWHDSPATKEITAARMKTTESLSFLVEGVAE